jgi:cellulose synthase/poly-beta-1,6-N-acetylglucosamine synthase-like glycosyltransferase
MILLLLILSIVISTLYLQKLQRAVVEASRLSLDGIGEASASQTGSLIDPISPPNISVLGKDGEIESASQTIHPKLPSISVIIPAYNEAKNIQACIQAVLESSQLSADRLEVWVVDDQSSDETLSLARQLAEQLQDPRLKILAGQLRPSDQIWVGKNWACTQVVQMTTGEFLLFVDADVRLQPGAIEAALQTAQSQQIDLLTCAPAITCECLAEWVIQPVMLNHLLVCFPPAQVSDATTDTIFAAGPFMLFRRSAYDQIGGHLAVAGEVVEDVELARRIKQANLSLGYYLAPQLVSVQMYEGWTDIWEGWTKNLYMGGQRQWTLMLYMALILISIYPIPWIALIVLTGRFFGVGWSITDWISAGLAMTGLWQQYQMRRWGAMASHTGTRYWGLSGLGGFIVAAMAIASFIKTETGWGWTWRGRPLSISQ